MIRYRRSNRVRDIVGVVFLALAALLLWIQTTSTGVKTGWAAEGSVTGETVVETGGAASVQGVGHLLLEAHG